MRYPPGPDVAVAVVTGTGRNMDTMIAERRYADLGKSARDACRPSNGSRRSDRLRRFTRAGVAATLAILARPSARPPPGDAQARVEVGSSAFRLSEEAERVVLDAVIADAA